MFRHGKVALILALATGLAAATASAQTTAPGAGGAAPAPPAKPMRHGMHHAKKAGTEKTAKPSMTEACEVDMAIFCGDLERKGARVAKCLKDNKAGVSSGCAAAL